MLSGTVFSVKLLAVICPIMQSCLFAFIYSFHRGESLEDIGSCFYIPFTGEAKRSIASQCGKNIT